MDTGHTAWMLTASALVFFMTPGLAFFYGGLVRAKNLVNTIMLSFMAISEEILPGVTKFILTEDANGNLLQFLPLTSDEVAQP